MRPQKPYVLVLRVDRFLPFNLQRIGTEKINKKLFTYLLRVKRLKLQEKLRNDLGKKIKLRR